MSTTGQRTANSMVLDADLDPEELWNQGLEHFRQERLLDAAWCFTVSYFLNLHLEPDKQLVWIDLVEAYLARGNGFDLPLIQALSLPVTDTERRDRFVLQALNQAQLASQDITEYYSDSATALDQVDRRRFGYAMIYVFAARIKGHQLREIPSDAPSTKREQVCRVMYQCVNMARYHIDAKKWLAMHFELGYTAYEYVREPDGTLEEAHGWLSALVQQLEGRLSLLPHHEGYKYSIEYYLSCLPMLQDSMNNNSMLIGFRNSNIAMRRFGTDNED